MNRKTFTPAARIEFLSSILKDANTFTVARNEAANRLKGMRGLYGTDAYKMVREEFDEVNNRMVYLRTKWIKETEQFHAEFSVNVDKRRAIAGLITKFADAGLKTAATEFAVPDKTKLVKIEL
jgi:hypothetical protein